MSEPLLTIARLTFPFPASALFGPDRARDANPAGRSFFPSRHPCIFGSDRARGANPVGRSRFCTVLSAQETKGPRRGAAFGSTPQVK